MDQTGTLHRVTARRWTPVATLVLLVTLGLMTLSPSLASAQGNSVAVDLCQEGGNQSLLGVSGSLTWSFVDEAGCIRFAAHGGPLLQNIAVPPQVYYVYVDNCPGSCGDPGQFIGYADWYHNSFYGTLHVNP